MTAEWILGIIGFAALTIVCGLAAERKKRAAQATPFTARYCTKHTVQREPLGGPEHLTWILMNTQNHLTPGNACDGAKHHRSVWWW